MGNEWIEWTGGDCPVPLDTKVDVRLRGGGEHPADDQGAGSWKWGRWGGQMEIIAYRIAEPELVTVPGNLAVQFKRLHQDAKTPSYATDGAACMDVRALHGGLINPGDAVLFSTGLALEVPHGHVMLVYSRSGMGFNHSTRLSNCVGVIDSDYRGELMVRLQNDGFEPLQINAHDRVAQVMIMKAPKFVLVEAEELSVTDRGTGGLGHTGSE